MDRRAMIESKSASREPAGVRPGPDRLRPARGPGSFDRVPSTLTRSAGHDLASSVLEIEFVVGRVSEDHDVPPEHPETTSTRIFAICIHTMKVESSRRKPARGGARHEE
jgi:hypothetical protein